ncbi:MAG: serine/threonine-protein kinase [Pseudomonadota bacterium]
MRKCEECGAENDDNASFCIACRAPLKARDTAGGLPTDPLPSPRPEPKTDDRIIELEPGTVFANRYEIIEKIGQGGMGAVYRAKETLGSTERAIALKLIKADLLANETARDRLIHEGVLTQSIRHPNVVAVHNVGIHKEQPFVAMAYVKGLSMREWLVRKFNYRNEEGLREEIPFAVCAQIIKSLLDGLEAAHSLNIVHRDLKPENVIFTSEPSEKVAELQILDFGIARAPGPPISTASGGMGTQGYMAPEQITNPAGVEPSADLYSLSRMFYEMLMDVLPAGHWQAPSGGRTDVPSDIDELIRKGLSDSPRSRQQSVAEYRKALEEAMRSAQSLSGPRRNQQKEPKVPDRPKKPIPPPPEPGGIPKPVMIGGGAALALFALIGVSQLDGGGGYDERDYGTSSSSSSGSSGGEIYTTSGSTSSSGGPGPGPEPVYPQSPYPSLSGTWYLPDGSTFPTTVAANGDFVGRSQDAMGNIYELRGNLEEGFYSLTSPTGPATGSLEWDGECHLEFVNSATFQTGMVHIDHPPSNDGGACPARFQQ